MSDVRHDRDRLLYRLVVADRLGESWLEWFGADAVEPGVGETVIWVRVADQAELFGRLRRIQDLNLRLLRLTLASPDAREASTSEGASPHLHEHEGTIP